MRNGLVATIALAAGLGLAQSAYANVVTTIDFNCATSYAIGGYAQGTANGANVCPAGHTNPNATHTNFTSWTEGGFTATFTSGNAPVNGVSGAAQNYSSLEWQQVPGYGFALPASGSVVKGSNLPNLANPVIGYTQIIIKNTAQPNEPFYLEDFYVGAGSGAVITGTVYGVSKSNTVLYTYTLTSWTVDTADATVNGKANPCYLSTVPCFELVTPTGYTAWNTGSVAELVIDLHGGYTKVDNIQVEVAEGGSSVLYLLLACTACLGAMLLAPKARNVNQAAA